jgi:hypothetical protein
MLAHANKSVRADIHFCCTRMLDGYEVSEINSICFSGDELQGMSAEQYVILLYSSQWCLCGDPIAGSCY